VTCQRGGAVVTEQRHILNIRMGRALRSSAIVGTFFHLAGTCICRRASDELTLLRFRDRIAVQR
jgi:hypothetical protein